MDKPDKTSLQSQLTPHEVRWASELSEKLPYDIDLTFDEIKILTRVHVDKWPKNLLDKVKEVMNFDEFQENDC